MPYISLAFGQKLDDAQKEKLKAETGRLISLIPGKTEGGLIVHILDSQAMYMGGSSEPCVYIDLKLYTKTTDEAKKTFTAEICAFIAKEFGVPLERQYLTMLELDNWGSKGTWR